MAEAKRESSRHRGRDVAVRPVVLITGAGGFLGGALSKALSSEFDVVGLDRSEDDLAHA